MVTRQQWLQTLMSLGMDMKSKGTVYGWKSPVNETNTLKKSTCVGYVSLALQRAKLLPEGKYVHYDNGKLCGTGLAYIKAHPEIFTIITAKATPQLLGERLHVGDICLYSVPHIQVYAGKNDNGAPIWYSLERSAGGVGKAAKLTLCSVFSFYSRRKIEYIIRIKFSDVTPAPDPAPLPAKYKTKQAMNLRDAPNAKTAKVIGHVPKGGVVTVIRSVTGTWKQVRYCELVGYMNCSTAYATKIQ